MFCCDTRPPGRRHIEELAVAAIPEQLPGLFELLSEVVLLDERIHMTVSNEQVFPSIVVEVQKGCAPFHILGVYGQTCRACNIIEGSIPEISIKRIGIAREVSFKYVKASVAVVIGRCCAHARLLATILVHSQPAYQTCLFKCPVVLVAKKQAGRRVAGDIKIGPAIIVEVAGQDCESVVLTRRLDAGLFRNVDEMPVAVVMVKRHGLALQSTRTAGYRHAFPIAAALITRRRR